MIPVAWLLLASSLQALDPGVAISQYAKRHWQVEDGLPQNYITSIAQTPDGYLLIGTAGGAARFDGLRFTPLVLDARTGMSREWITAVAASQDGHVWVASRDAGSYLFAPRVLTPLRHSPMRFDSLSAGVNVVAGLGPEGYWVWRQDGSQPLCPELRTGNPSWQALLEHYIAAGGNLYWRSAGSCFKTLSLKAQVLAITEGTHLDIWIGASDGLYRADHSGQAAGHATRVEGVPGPVVYVLEDRDGVVWAATWGNGLYRVTAKGVDAWTTRDGLPDDFVHNLFEDREGNLWIGSRAGLSRWKSTPVSPFGIAEGLGGQFISTISGDRDGNLWIGSWRSGLHRFRDGRMQHEKLPSPDLDVLIRASASSPSGTLWLSTWQELLERTEAGWRRYPQQAYSLAFDQGGAMWMGSGNGVYRFDGGRPDDSPPIVKASNVSALLIDTEGTVWAGALDGLWRVEREPTRLGGLPHRSITSLSEDSSGRVWATTRANGITLINQGQPRTIDQRHGLPALPVYAVLDDDRGAMWLSTPAGIYSVATAHIAEIVDGKRTRLEPELYGQDDGMRTIECQSVGFPSGWKASDGALWFPTVRGVVRIRPSTRKAHTPPHVVIESDTSEARTHIVRFTAPRMSGAERVEFRYKTKGSDWTSAGAERILRFNNLPAGSHTLSIAARETGSEWGPSINIVLDQPPRFHETWTFRLLCSAALAVLFFLFYQWRLYLVKGRYRAVIAERNRISREWHDTLLAGFSAISWQLDAALQRLRDKPESAAKVVETARSMVHHYKAEARRVIWDLRSNEPELPALEQAVQTSVAEMTAHCRVTSKVEVSGEPVALPGDLAQNVLRICQEAVINALQHGAPSRISVHLRFGQDRLEAAIEDDGKGFDPTAIPNGHFGLAIVRERARRFGGDIEIVTGSGRGTILTASIPYPAANA
ncbi:MAG: ATP-binding protein [Bryobacterales bacterium]|nr:ATP-binding protein [Bryobacterales bacterium]